MRLDRKKFTAWLKAKTPDEIVGHNRDCHCCPIALFYANSCGGEIVIFDRDGEYYIDRGDQARRAPAWAAEFIFAVDGDDNGKISARRALEVLNQI